MSTNTAADDAVTAALKSLPEAPAFLKEKEEIINQDAEVDMSVVGTVKKKTDDEIELDRLQTLYSSAGYTDQVNNIKSLQNWEKSYNQQQTATKALPWMIFGLLVFASWLAYTVGKDVFKIW